MGLVSSAVSFVLPLSGEEGVGGGGGGSSSTTTSMVGNATSFTPRFSRVLWPVFGLRKNHDLELPPGFCVPMTASKRNQ